MATEQNEWFIIRNTLTKYLDICHCQRKIKSIIDSLYSIYLKCREGDYDFTGAEWLLIALLNKTEYMTHGINCEYPIITDEDGFWKWIKEIKNSPYLIDN